MKNETVSTTNYFLRFKIQPLCESLLQYLLSVPSWCLQSDVKTMLLSRASRVLKTGRTASLAHLSNARHLTGDVFIALAVLSFFFRYFFSPLEDDRSWYYTGWFYFFGTLRPWMIGVFGTLALLYYWPKKSKSVYIVFTSLHSLCLLGVLHYSFNVHDYDSFHSYPAWGFWLLAAEFGIGCVLAADHLVYVFEHKIKGNHKRWVMLEEHKSKLDAATHQRMLRNNLNEYHQLYTHY